MVNIQLFGMPGVGKTGTAGGLLHEMKKQNISVEYVTEVAKDIVWSKDFFSLKDQMMITARQHHQLWKLDGQVDFTVNDGPFLIGLAFLQDSPHLPRQEFEDLVVKMYRSYDNINILLEESNKFGYQQAGRKENQGESFEIGAKIKVILDRHQIPYHVVKVSDNVVEDILKIVVRS